ncbi:GntG family PLP-dependent aldolase [Aliiroseovarius sediminis]|uniref:threonine aldolase family protein n=1 Tax=Aliiroseovarius sediminis TaxID=2925839 RepID=UPI001F5682F0|nr:GntG family PLP-dependent aldolase [Aliiroseovarius sediminis]MCI2394726.1 beta-eliminating lyase-related protein [Aliiroseovarius sediminis]
MSHIHIDLISDTATRPSPGMLRAMADAPTGDEQRGEDPTTLQLCERVAALVGMDDAIFLPSGTMCNQIAFLVHCRPGDEIIAAANAHIVRSEGAGAAALAGAQINAVPTPTGIFTAADAAPMIRAQRDRAPVTRLISVEQTTNFGGGAVWPVDVLQDLAKLANGRNLALHMDGARLLNAAVASGQPANTHCKGFVSTWIDLSKGLGCPVGAVLAGSADFIERAWTWKHRLGGAMRQSGILAAAGLYALDHNVTRLAEDHENAKLLAHELVGTPGVSVAPDKVETNILFIETSGTGKTTRQINDVLAGDGIRLQPESPTRFRAVTHLDVTRDQIKTAAAAIRRACAD